MNEYATSLQLFDIRLSSVVSMGRLYSHAAYSSFDGVALVSKAPAV